MTARIQLTPGSLNRSDTEGGETNSEGFYSLDERRKDHPSSRIS